jgi:hypothetical protein
VAVASQVFLHSWKETNFEKILFKELSNYGELRAKSLRRKHFFLGGDTFFLRGGIYCFGFTKRVGLQKGRILPLPDSFLPKNISFFLQKKKFPPREKIVSSSQISARAESSENVYSIYFVGANCLELFIQGEFFVTIFPNWQLYMVLFASVFEFALSLYMC